MQYEDITLVIMASGMGSRCSGFKQIDPIGANGEIIFDYSVYDAIRQKITDGVYPENLW